MATVPAPRGDRDPLAQLLDYAREHSVSLAKLEGSVTSLVGGQADHEARIRVLEGLMTAATARTGLLSRVTFLLAGSLLAEIVHRLAGS